LFEGFEMFEMFVKFKKLSVPELFKGKSLTPQTVFKHYKPFKHFKQLIAAISLLIR